MSTFLKHLLSFLRLAHNVSQTMQSLTGPAHLSITQRVDSEFCQTVLTEMEIIFSP